MAKVTSRWAHSKEITGIAYTPDGSTLVTAAEEYALHVFPQIADKPDAAAEKIITDEEVTCLVVNKTDVYAGAADGIVRQYNIRSRESMGAVGRYDLPIRCLAQSPNGAYLAVGTESSDVKMITLDDVDQCWNFKGHKKAISSFSFDPEGQFLPVTCVGWSPNGKFLAASSTDSKLCADSDGELSRWDNVVDEKDGTPLNRPEKDPLAGLFDEEAAEDVAVEDNVPMEYMSEDESLNDFIVDDDSNKYKPTARSAETRRPHATGKMQPAKVLHPCFQSGSTKMRDSRRYLDFNGLGIISTVDHGSGTATISVEFHDKLSGRGYHFADNNNYSMGCLGKLGAFFAANAADGNPATIHYKMHEYLGSKFEWQNYLPEGEDVTAIALNGESAIVTTTRGYVRVFSQSGIQTGLFSVGSVIAAAGKDDLVILLHHLGEPFAGSQNLGYVMYNVETGQRIQQGTLPVSDDTYVTWLGFSSGGIPAFYDDNGVMHVLNYYRRVDQGQWSPILDTSLVVPEAETVATPYYWPVSLTDEEMKCVKCKRHEREPSFPKPYLTDLPLRMPTLYQNSETGKHEEAWLRTKILSGLNKDEKIAMSVERSDNVVARKELEMDKLAILLIDEACKAERTQKALDLTAMLCNLRSIDAAIKIAHIHNLHSLMERMSKVREIKRMAEEDRDPDAERDLIMADPVVAVVPPRTREASAFQEVSKQDEEVFERRSVQRRAPVQANDPFGRRVVKESLVSKTAAKNGGHVGTGMANPFKKSAGPLSNGGVSGAKPTRGFGSVVSESERHGGALPITRRAADVFEAADLLTADEQRAKAERERQVARQDDLMRKRKANGGATTTTTATGGQQQTVQQLFNKSVGTNMNTDPKRFKKAQEESAPMNGQEEEDDSMMDADDFLEEPEEEHGEDEGEYESQPPAAQRIPNTQEDEEVIASSSYGDYNDLDDTIEETRGHFEQTRVATSPVSKATSRSSSSVLAGFKFNKS
ncbi:hypothetical protein BGZ94_005626 [Podila epigama]|nr:hypothetical protein BGZ94_005626 [Podila epigama]